VKLQFPSSKQAFNADEIPNFQSDDTKVRRRFGSLELGKLEICLELGAWNFVVNLMNIAIDIRCLMERELTGVGEYARELLENIFKEDNTNQYYLFYNSRKDVSGVLPRFEYQNVKYCQFRWPNKLLSFCLLVFKWPKLDQLIMKKYKTEPVDLFFFPNIGFISSKCPYIITAHDLSFAFFPEFLSLGRKIWHKLVNPARLFRNAHKIIAVSENTGSDLNRFYCIKKDKITVVLSGVNEKFHPLPEDDQHLAVVRQKYQLPENFFLFLGTLEPRKNVLSLISAFTKFQPHNSKKISLVIAGKRGWKCNDVLRKIEEFNENSGEKIYYLDYVDPSDKVALYNLAGCFVFPSFYEGFGFPALEAMASGCPVICSNNSSLSEICGNGAMLVDANNTADLAMAMETLAGGDSVSEYGARSLQRAKRYSWKRTAAETLTLLMKKPAE
jgi:glycosyltransferase involved in cell wall biosynthesis